MEPGPGGGPGGIVTGEAVLLELRPAQLPSRALGAAVDLVVQLAALFVVFALVGLAPAVGADSALLGAVALAATVAVVVGYPVACETLTRGRTLGKWVLGLRVVRGDGGAIRFRHALVRGLFAAVEVWLTAGVVAVLVSLLSARGQRLGDVFAGTVVVRERVPAGTHPGAVMPPGLAAWAGHLDLARLPDDLALAVRQYLARHGQLAPAVAADMGRRLAADVAAWTSPPPPAGTAPPAYLAAVLVERRRRELSRATVARPASGTGLGEPGGGAGEPRRAPSAGQDEPARRAPGGFLPPG